MKKFAVEYVILFLQMTFVGIFILYIYSSYVDAYNENFLDRSMYSENVAGIQLSNQSLADAGEIVTLDLDDITVDRDFAVYKYVSYTVSESCRRKVTGNRFFSYSESMGTSQVARPRGFPYMGAGRLP